MIAIAFITTQLPTLVYEFAARRRASIEQQERDPVKAWRNAPLVEFSHRNDGGMAADFSKGPNEAPIKLVEFADFECPACRRLYQSMKPWLQNFEGKYQLTFRNYPLDNSCNPQITRPFHRTACAAAFFSRCAAEQGKFWESVDFLFTYEGLDTPDETPDLEHSIIADGSRHLQLDEEAIRVCMESGRYREKILEDIQEGNRIGLHATPTLWVNGRQARTRPLDNLEKVFQAILDEKKDG
jgi:protein-disulfide isomerase